mmetsp:Transcript_96927/g.152773  ORF Transcript_96927/g.152773 Transcript_96927/m.152773 type:complete len:812 (+) Transcript_96927:66-2501(+)
MATASLPSLPSLRQTLNFPLLERASSDSKLPVWKQLGTLVTGAVDFRRRTRFETEVPQDVSFLANGHKPFTNRKSIGPDSHCKRCGKEELEVLQQRDCRNLCNACMEYVMYQMKDAPGSYVVVEDNLFLFTEAEHNEVSEEHKDFVLVRGDIIFVQETAKDRVRGRIRGRIEYPFAGWVSLANTADGHRKCCPFHEVSLLLQLYPISATRSPLEHCVTCKQRTCNPDLQKAVQKGFEELNEARLTFGERESNKLDFDWRPAKDGRVLLELRGLAVEEVKLKLDTLKVPGYRIQRIDRETSMSPNKVRRSGPKILHGQPLGVWAVIIVQFVLYMCVNSQQPALFQKISVAFPDSADSTYSFALSSTNVVKLGAPVILGYISERHAPRSAYLFAMIIGAAASLTTSTSQSAIMVALGWGVLQEGPPSIRNVRYLYMARRCTSADLNRLSQHATTFGLFGGAIGNLLAGIFAEILGPERADEWPDAFLVASLTNVFCFLVAFVLLFIFMGVSVAKNDSKTLEAAQCRNCERPSYNGELGAPCCRVCKGPPPANCDFDKLEALHSSECNRRHRVRQRLNKVKTCERVGCDRECRQRDAAGLCDFHYENYAEGMSFHRYKICCTIFFCLVQSMLEFGVNAVVITTFQPIVVKTFGWGASRIATVMLVGSILSFSVSQTVAMLSLRPLTQSAVAAGCYTISVFFFTVPPLSEWRIVIALILGLKAQILFSSPFSSLYAEKMGKERLTQWLSTAFQLAPGLGGMLGAASAPFFLSVAGQPLFMLPALPVLASLGLLACFWRHLETFNRPREKPEDSNA